MKRFVFTLLFWVPAFAGMTMLPITAHAATKPELMAEHKDDLAAIQKYLNGLYSLVSDFTQVAPDGSLTGGKFFLKRPGKMRWQYEPPTPILMVSDGHQMVYYDYELEQVSYIPLDATMASFLAREKIDLADPFITIEEFAKNPGMLRLTIVQTDKPESGRITLEFSDTPLQLRNMVVTDSQGQITTIALNNAQMGVELEDKLFQFVDPRKNRRKN